jgi:acyl-CoA reductase-like NAD-dependent aldehyde dehydrogenase
VSAANKAFKTWSRTAWEERSELLIKFADELEKYKDEMNDLLEKESGKTV